MGTETTPEQPEAPTPPIPPAGGGDRQSRLDPALRFEGVRRGDRLVGAHGMVYEINKRLGGTDEGTFGTLWLADHTQPGTGHHFQYALKVLVPRHSPGPDAARREYERGTDRGAFVVDFRDHSPDGAQPAFIVMEYLRGETLESQVLRDGPLDVSDRRHLLLALAGALSSFHGDPQRRMYHGDWQPKNIVRLTEDGGLRTVGYKVVDLGHGHREDTPTTGARVRAARYLTPESGAPVHELGELPIYVDLHLIAQVIVFAWTGRHLTSHSRTDRHDDLPYLADTIGDGFSAELGGLLRDLLSYDIRERRRRAPVERVVERLRRLTEEPQVSTPEPEPEPEPVAVPRAAPSRSATGAARAVPTFRVHGLTVADAAPGRAARSELAELVVTYGFVGVADGTRQIVAGLENPDPAVLRTATLAYAEALGSEQPAAARQLRRWVATYYPAPSEDPKPARAATTTNSTNSDGKKPDVGISLVLGLGPSAALLLILALGSVIDLGSVTDLVTSRPMSLLFPDSVFGWIVFVLLLLPSLAGAAAIAVTAIRESLFVSAGLLLCILGWWTCLAALGDVGVLSAPLDRWLGADLGSVATIILSICFGVLSLLYVAAIHEAAVGFDSRRFVPWVCGTVTAIVMAIAYAGARYEALFG